MSAPGTSHPPEMTPGEKLAAEWEARHDVAARGAHGSPAGVQDYLRHRRLEGDGAGAGQEPHAAPRPPSAPAPDAPAATGRWWERLLPRRPR